MWPTTRWSNAVPLVLCSTKTSQSSILGPSHSSKVKMVSFVSGEAFNIRRCRYKRFVVEFIIIQSTFEHWCESARASSLLRHTTFRDVGSACFYALCRRGSSLGGDSVTEHLVSTRVGKYSGEMRSMRKSRGCRYIKRGLLALLLSIPCATIF